MKLFFTLWNVDKECPRSASCPWYVFSFQRAENETSHADSLTFSTQFLYVLKNCSNFIYLFISILALIDFYHITFPLPFLFPEAHIYIYSNPSLPQFLWLKLLYICACVYMESHRNPQLKTMQMLTSYVDPNPKGHIYITTTASVAQRR